MTEKQRQIGSLHALAHQLERDHQREVLRMNRTPPSILGPVDPNEHWEANFAARHRALTGAMAIILEADDQGDVDAFKAALAAQKR